jgi:hypothetical protein
MDHTLSMAAHLRSHYSNDSTSSLARECLVRSHMLSAVRESETGYVDDDISLPGCEYIVLDRAVSMVATAKICYSDEGMSTLGFGSSFDPESMFSEVKHCQINKRDDGKNTAAPACFVLYGSLSAVTNFLNGNIDDGVSSLHCEHLVLPNSPLSAAERLGVDYIEAGKSSMVFHHFTLSG